MIPPDYLLLRLLRRTLPAPAMHGLLRHRVVVRPGLETREPEAAAARYEAALAEVGRRLEGATVMDFGYGGSIGLGLALLARGARKVVLLDPYAPIDLEADRRWAAQASAGVTLAGGEVVLDPDRLVREHRTIQAYVAGGGEPVDVVLSWSVLEHVDDPEGVIAALAAATRPGGVQVHCIDLRDHVFRHPFEMLCHSAEVWRRLNPPSNLNRWRLWQYEAVFRRYFRHVAWEALERDLAAFRRARPRIRPEFLSGDEAVDAVTRVLFRVAEPRPPAQAAQPQAAQVGP